MDVNLNSETSAALFQAKGMKDFNPSLAKTKEGARAAAEDFEAVFLHQLVELMWTEVPTDGPFGGGHSESVFRSMLNEEYSKQIAGNGGIGLADDIYREILKMQNIEE